MMGFFLTDRNHANAMRERNRLLESENRKLGEMLEMERVRGDEFCKLAKEQAAAAEASAAALANFEAMVRVTFEKIRNAMETHRWGS